MARYVYSCIFLVLSVLAWSLRDYGTTTLPVMERLNGCGRMKDCLGARGSLRVSFGSFIFFFVMFVSTLGTSKMHQRREEWHSGKWLAKFVIILAVLLLALVMPSMVLSFYGGCAHFGACIFLFIQLFSTIKSVSWLNACSLSKKYVDKYRSHMMVVAAASHVASVIGMILMYVWYTPNLSCHLNILFITLTLLFLVMMISVSSLPTVNSGFLTPSLMGLYIVFLCWSAIKSEPPEIKCFQETKSTNDGVWLTIMSFVVGVISNVIATFSTGKDSKCFQFREDENQEEVEDDVPYGYGFFHFVFATGSMYFAMLITGWNSHHSMKKFSIDVGWTSTWVRIANQWLMVFVYIFMLVVPVMWRGRQRAESQVV